MSNRRARSAIVASQKGLFQIPCSVPSDLFHAENSFEALFVDVPARLLFVCKKLCADTALMDVVDFWRPRVPKYNDDILVCYSSFEHIVTGHLRLGTGAEDMQDLMRVEANAA